MASKAHKEHKRRPVSELADAISAIIGGDIDIALLDHALTHRSYAYENGGLPNNERLEFLGDSVLGLVVTESLYADHPDLAEGQLAKLRAAVVNMRALAKVAKGLGVGDYLLLGRGEESTGGRSKASILADTMEAVIGAVFLSAGPDAATALVLRLVEPLLADKGGEVIGKTPGLLDGQGCFDFPAGPRLVTNHELRPGAAHTVPLVEGTIYDDSLPMGGCTVAQLRVPRRHSAERRRFRRTGGRCPVRSSGLQVRSNGRTVRRGCPR